MKLGHLPWLLCPFFVVVCPRFHGLVGQIARNQFCRRHLWGKGWAKLGLPIGICARAVSEGFGAYFNRLHKLPAEVYLSIPDEVTVCRCEDVKTGDIRRSVTRAP